MVRLWEVIKMSTIEYRVMQDTDIEKVLFFPGRWHDSFY